MNREIKFRAWDGDKKEMNWPEYSDKEVFHISAEGDILETHEYGYERHEITSYRPNTWVLMQFTGLRDKNGVEIYEGDILIMNLEKDFKKHKSNSFVMEWNPVRAAWSDYSPREIVEVIGNIYEHPELLK